MKKRKRRLVRTSILIVLISAVVYTLYLNATKDQAILVEGDMAPDFKLETLDGDTVQLSDFRGKGVFLNFWGTWCKPCEKEMPYMEKSYQQFKDKGVETLAVNIGESDFLVNKFVGKYDLSFTFPMDRNRELIDTYGIGPIPTTFLINPEGKVVKIITGSMSQQDIHDYMNMIKPEQ
ncbi:extracytoplasmic thioredoxin involved in cytochrome c maturation (lipoprotein) [Bacillus sp. 349Y]|nr:extracytoplasmic thioredoxin involved in cytochrome c maturation (lipoprotein) [Bacillus sp. 349Y]